MFEEKLCCLKKKISGKVKAHTSMNSEKKIRMSTKQIAERNLKMRKFICECGKVKCRLGKPTMAYLVNSTQLFNVKSLISAPLSYASQRPTGLSLYWRKWATLNHMWARTYSVNLLKWFQWRFIKKMWKIKLYAIRYLKGMNTHCKLDK